MQTHGLGLLRIGLLRWQANGHLTMNSGMKPTRECGSYALSSGCLQGCCSRNFSPCRYASHSCFGLALLLLKAVWLHRHCLQHMQLHFQGHEHHL